jgi:large subunit ribosomal protein L35
LGFFTQLGFFYLYKAGVTPFVPTLYVMQKTRKSISKRFKVTGSGKVMRRSPNTRHLLSSKSRKQRRRANKSKRVDSGFEKKMKISMPFA